MPRAPRLRRHPGRVWQIEQGFVEFGETDEVLYILGEVADGEIAGLGVVPLEGKVYVVRLKGFRLGLPLEPLPPSIRSSWSMVWPPWMSR